MGIAFIPFIKYICNQDIPEDINIYIIYGIYILNSVLTYFLLAYKSSILVAHQKNYAINNINTIVNFLLNILQIIILLYATNYYLYLSMILFCTVFYNLITAVYVD